MFKKISLTMAVVYGLIIIAAISTLDLLIILNYRQEQLDKNEAKHILFAEIISNVVKDTLDDTMELNGTIRENSAKLEGRVLVVNNDNKVLADNYAYYIGKQITSSEVDRARESKEQVIEYYQVDGTNIMIAAVPILVSKEVKAVVLISAYIDDILKDIQDLTRLTIGVSILACIISVGLSLILGRKLSQPIEELTAASEEILKGNLNTKVDIDRQDEIGKLAETFNKMSEELYKTDSNRRRFMSDVSHELKTPLTSIKALIESLIDGNNEVSTYKEYLVDINGEIDRLSIMVKSLLTVTRLEEMELRREQIDIKEETGAIAKLLTPLADQHGTHLVNNCQEGITVEADRSKLKEVLINLVDNSIKYGRKDGFTELGCRQTDYGIELYVKDNGQGIPDKDIESIFDIFYRVDESRTRKTGGNGIGLYIVKRIVELHGWSIKVRSKLGEGTEFIIEIRSSI
ncbi:MAG: hypothetical protein K0R84_1052 [Clostridia bacterium]|nr:hypothetical protein [Clostridia bacterium]